MTRCHSCPPCALHQQLLAAPGGSGLLSTACALPSLQEPSPSSALSQVCHVSRGSSCCSLACATRALHATHAAHSLPLPQLLILLKCHACVNRVWGDERGSIGLQSDRKGHRWAWGRFLKWNGPARQHAKRVQRACSWSGQGHMSRVIETWHTLGLGIAVLQTVMNWCACQAPCYVRHIALASRSGVPWWMVPTW